jgi:competence protein ComEA
MHIKPIKLAVLLTGLMLFGSVLAGQPVDINQASAQSLAESLDGVGMSKAEAIVAYRKTHGPFQHPDELVNVKGIGLSTVDKNRNNIVIEAARTVAKKKN